MFNLIVVIISIALVGALAIATMWYGGTIMTSGQIQSAVSGTLNQSQQIATATGNFTRSHNANMPTSVAQLVSSGYLGAEPTPNPDVLNSGWAFFNYSGRSYVRAEVEYRVHTRGVEFCELVNMRATGGTVMDPMLGVDALDHLPFFCALDNDRAVYFYYGI
jgi:hypothetical protein